MIIAITKHDKYVSKQVTITRYIFVVLLFLLYYNDSYIRCVREGVQI